MPSEFPRILITPGEPAGIGPDIVIDIASHAFPGELIAVCDPTLIENRAKLLGIPLTVVPTDLKTPPSRHVPGTLNVFPVALNTPVTPGTLNQDNASYVIETLKQAALLASEKKADALVTGPVHKGILNEAGFSFTGHTEFLADFFNVKQVVMLFVTEKARVALCTTHIPLQQVSSALTQTRLKNILQLLHQELKSLFDIKDPVIFVAGVNPHAGESGHLGNEEKEILIPVLNELQQQNLRVEGPFSADTLFTEKNSSRCDAILAMYHDQALPVVKYMSFGNAVNITLGLPILRTSVDHGTALDIAGSGKADAGSLKEALWLAKQLIHHRLSASEKTT